MTVFACASCEHPISGDLRVGEFVTASQFGPGGELTDDPRTASPRMAPGTYAVSHDTTLLILHPDDVPGVALHPDRRRRNGCCGLDGRGGPNLVCAACGVDIATKESDCWTDNLVALIAAAVVGKDSQA
ncbi:hypothetical protein [Yinghuangia soli]|uniref:Uncharacterized protein n=1 Tax=Yinghuangia soli TaxID=2908204 RepID=A0AA41Q9I4_9ACTN|nr:hypothetical protein [Yinghuangia soli]MCF2534070.1 hypothetical protein [Yinghuangia soli]